MTAQRRHVNCILFLAFVTACLPATMLSAATPFRWRLQPEQSYELQVNWTSSLSRPSFEISQRAQAQLNWKIVAVDEAGNTNKSDPVSIQVVPREEAE